MAKKRKILKSFITRYFVIIASVIIIFISLGATRAYLLLLKNNEQNIFSEQIITVQNNITKLQNDFSHLVYKTNDIAVIFSNYNVIPEQNRRVFFKEFMLEVLEENPNIYGIWTTFKPYSIDSLDYEYSNDIENLTGQFAATFYRQNEHLSEKYVDIDDYKLLDIYLPQFRQNKSMIIDAPIEDPYWQLAGKSYIIRNVAPIVNKDNHIIGIIGIDVNINFFDNLLSGKNNHLFILNKNKDIIYNKNIHIIGKNFNEIYPIAQENINFNKNYIIDEIYYNKGKLFNSQTTYYSLFPFVIPYQRKTFKVLYAVDQASVFGKRNKGVSRILLIPTIFLLVFIIVLLLFFRQLKQIFDEIIQNTTLIAYKDKQIEFSHYRTQEMLSIIKSLKRHKNLLDKYKLNLQNIIDENYGEIVGIDKDKILFDELEKLRIKLQKEKNESLKIRHEQELETKISNALADLNNIQREFVNDIETLAYQTIKYISDFTDAVQAGFYILVSEDDNKFLDLTAFYSYNRRIYEKKKIALDDGLAGTCAIEKKYIYTKVPDNYLEITSGLGKESPNYIFLVPLIHNDEVYGVMEFAYLNGLEDFHKRFFETASDIVASTVATAKNNLQTQKLLSETQRITEEIRRKEEDMAKQIAELEKIKQKSASYELDMSAIFAAIDKTIFYAEFDTKTNTLLLNNNLSEKLQIMTTDIMLLTYYDVFMITDHRTHERYWEKVLSGKTVEYELEIAFGKFDVWFKAVLAPVFNISNQVYKVIFLAVDYSDLKRREKEVKKLMVELNEKAEQISVQEIEMDEFVAEYQEITEKYEQIKQEIEQIREEKKNIEHSMEFLQKEFKKRATRSKRIEQNLKKKIRLLEEDLKNCKNDNNEKQ